MGSGSSRSNSNTSKTGTNVETLEQDTTSLQANMEEEIVNYPNSDRSEDRRQKGEDNAKVGKTQGHNEIKPDQGDSRMQSTDKDINRNELAMSSKLTPEEINTKTKDTIGQLEIIMRKMAMNPYRHIEQENAPYTKEFRQAVLKLAKSYFHFKMEETPYSVIAEFRKDIGSALNVNGTVKLMCDVMADGLRRKDFINNSGEMQSEYWLPLKNIVLTLLNYSDLDIQVQITIAEHPDLLQLIVQYLQDWHKDHLNQKLTENQDKLIKWSMTLLHNCASSDENVSRLRDLGVIKVVLPYTDSSIENIRLSSISVVALLANEEESELLVTHVSIFQFMIKKLGKAIKKEDRKDLGWSALELTVAIGKLARNDANKKVLVQEGCLPILVEVLKTGNVKEIKESVTCLWTLSFDEDNKKKMVDEPGLVEVIYHKYQTSEGSVRNSCQGILWSLSKHLMIVPRFKQMGEEISDTRHSSSSNLEHSSKRAVSGSLKVKGHVMISYQWANQEVIKQICQTLRNHGIRVWIDVDFMEGSTLEAMARAVEESVAVIIAMSQKYKDSPNTRAEAEYTFQQRKPIIPLMMQKGYRPDGWLGVILGTKIFYDFSGKYPFQTKMDALLGVVKGIYDLDKTDGSDTYEQLIQPTTSIPQTTEKPNTNRPIASLVDEQVILKWTKDDIRKWLTKFNIKSSTLKLLSPEEILFLHNLRSEAPEFFYHCLESKLKLTSLLDLGRAAKAFSSLTLT